jgi:hypothetical protein
LAAFITNSFEKTLRDIFGSNDLDLVNSALQILCDEQPSHDDTKSTISIADELNKLVKLKEQGAITEEEFSQKSNLMKRM